MEEKDNGTVSEAIAKVTPSLILVAIITGASMTVGSFLGQLVVGLIKKRR